MAVACESVFCEGYPIDNTSESESLPFYRPMHKVPKLL